jgi:hypothetical protein
MPPTAPGRSRGATCAPRWPDGIRTHDGAVVRVGADPVRLGPLGLTLWDDAAGLVDRAVEALVHAGVLRAE